MKKKETRGGTRKGSGAKPKYNEEEKAEQKALFIADVRQHRELLNAFLEHCEVIFGKLPYDKNEMIDSWIESI